MISYYLLYDFNFGGTLSKRGTEVKVSCVKDGFIQTNVGIMSFDEWRFCITTNQRDIL